ncbi:MAG: hypothetical protein AAB632_00490 [Patescibacteria group bacterium]
MQMPPEGPKHEEQDDGGIFDIQEENDLRTESSKLVELAKKHGPSMDDLRIALEENRKKYEENFKVDKTDDEIRKYTALKKEIEDLESLLSHYDHMTPEDKKRMDLELEELIEQNPED